jgi:putative PIN family toxin of toxin-antitoxin system
VGREEQKVVMSPSYHVVFDCNIFVQALLNPEGVGGACLELVRRGNINLYVSPEILKEIREVLQRPTVISRFPSLTPDVVDAFLDDIIMRISS